MNFLSLPNTREYHWKKTMALLSGLFLSFLGIPGAEATIQAQTISPVSSRTMLQAPYLYQWHQWSQMPDDRLHLYLRLLDTKVENATLFLRMRMVSDNLSIENAPPEAPQGVILFSRFPFPVSPMILFYHSFQRKNGKLFPPPLSPYGTKGAFFSRAARANAQFLRAGGGFSI